MRFQHTGGKLYARNMPCMEEVRERGTFRASNAYSLFVTTRLKTKRNWYGENVFLRFL